MKNCLVPERLAARLTRANSEYLSRANHANFSGHATGWWIALWFYLDTLPSTIPAAMTLWDTRAGSANGVHLYVRDDNEPAVSAYGAVSDVTKRWGDVVAANEWFFVYCDYDGADLRIQINDGTIVTQAYTDYVASSTTLYLGSLDGTSNYLDGRIQCVMCGHPNILTAAEIAWLYSEVPKWNSFGKSGIQSTNHGNCEFYQYLGCGGVAGVAYGDGLGIPAKTLVGWDLCEESDGVSACLRQSPSGLNLTDNNTTTSVRGLNP